MSKITKTREKFIEQSINLHGNKYDYSKVEYKKYNIEVIIICPKHGEFIQKPSVHLVPAGCQRCKVETRAKTQEQIINDFTFSHGDKYDYSKVKYTIDSEKVCIVCHLHGEFWQEPGAHKRGVGCPLCYEKSRVKTREDFIMGSKKVHGDKYNYSKVVYTGDKNEVCIICSRHGEFWQKPNCHLRGHKCQKCNKIILKDGTICDSQAEAYLCLKHKENGIDFLHNKKYGEELGNMRYDFYFPSLNLYEEITSYCFKDGNMSHIEKRIKDSYLEKIEKKRKFVENKGGKFIFVELRLNRKQQMYVFANAIA